MAATGPTRPGPEAPGGRVGQTHYDPKYFQRHGARNEKRVEAIVSNLPAGATRVLDIGCNRGYFSRAVLERGLAPQVDGIEPSASEVDPKLLADDRFTLHETDVRDYDFPHRYSAVIYCAVHHHVFGHHGYVEAMELWRRIVDSCDRHVFFETGQLLEGAKWYWQRAIRRYYASDEEHIGALLQAAGRRLRAVRVIDQYAIHGTRRWLLRIDLEPRGETKPAPERPAVPAHDVIETYRRTIGSRGQRLVSSGGVGYPPNVHQGTRYTLCERRDTGARIWCKKALDDPYKNEREYVIGSQVESDLFVRPITLDPGFGLVFPFVEGEKLSDVDLHEADNRAEIVEQLLDVFEEAERTPIALGDLDFDPRQRGTTRRLVDVVDLHPANVLVRREGRSLRIAGIVDLEYFRNENAPRNAQHLAKIILASRVVTPRTLGFLRRAAWWQAREQARWATASIEDRLYERFPPSSRKWTMRGREAFDHLTRWVPGRWE